MFGMIRRYLKGRARIIAKAQMKNTLKKVAKNIRDGKYSNDSAISNANTIKSNVRKKSALGTQIMAIIVSASLIAPYNVNAATAVVSNPERIAQAYTQFVEQIEKYNTIIKNAQDTLDTMNRINDLTTQANSMINNLQTGLADPTQLYDRFQANLENIKNSAETLAENMKNKEWSEAFIKRDYASCQTKWQTLLKEFKQRKEEEKRKQQTSETDQEEPKKEQQEATNKEGLNQNQQVIDAEMKTLNQVYTQGHQNLNDKIHGFFNTIQNYMNYGNMENQIKGIQNPYAYQKRICQMVEIEYWNNEIFKAKSCYLENAKEGKWNEAKKCLQKAKYAEYEKAKARKERTEAVYDKAHRQFNTSTQANILDINDNTGELTPDPKKTKDWETAMRKAITDKTQVAESKKVTSTDEKGNKTTTTVWVAKLETIKNLISNNKLNEALALQNKRNMAIALQGDTQAIQQSQLETAQLLSFQINKLNESINELGNVQNEFLRHFLDDSEDEFRRHALDNKTTEDKMNIHNISHEKTAQDIMKINENSIVVYENGLPALKPVNKQDGNITE